MKNNLFEFYKSKKVFITGHTGFKGTWLCNILFASGAYVTGFALEPQTQPSLFALTNTENKMQSIIGDICNYSALETAVKNAQPEIVFHLAAQPLVRFSYSEPVTTYQTNVMGTVHILEAVRKVQSVKSFLNVTTDKVYENKEWHWGYRENETLCGFDPYSNSKSCSELVTSSYKNSFFNLPKSTAISTARSGNVIGGGDFALDRIIPDCIRSAQKKETIIVRNPFSTRPYQHVLECLNGYLLLAQKQYEDKTFSGSYNFGPNDESCVTTSNLAELFCSNWKNGAKWNTQCSDADKKMHEANFLKLDCTKANTVLGWKPHWNIKIAVAKTVEWVKAVQDGIDAGTITREQIEEYFRSISSV